MRRRVHQLVFAILLLIVHPLAGQETPADETGWGTNYPAVDERRFLETKWKYTYAIHLESNTTIHKAEDFYEYFLYFRYNYTYQQYLNGRLTKGKFEVDGSELLYSFKHIKQFEIAELSKNRLVLEFKQSNSKGTYQYHFIKVESKDAPFIKPPNELPDVIVERENRKKDSGIFSFLKKRKEKKRKNKQNKKRKVKEKPVYISIELIGGGYYGGIDPVLKDYIQIKSDGRLIKEFKTANKGSEIVKKDIPREELEQFAQFVESKGFFEFDRIYDCESLICHKRKKGKPAPVPLRLAIAYGQKKKVVTITIWGKDKHQVQYVDYPPALEAIILAIQKMAHRIERPNS